VNNEFGMLSRRQVKGHDKGVRGGHRALWFLNPQTSRLSYTGGLARSQNGRKTSKAFVPKDRPSADSI